MSPAPAAPFLEIFPSVQGEGVLAGVPQVFARLGGCNLRCRYCDTPESIGRPPPHMVHRLRPGTPGEAHPNPVTVEKAAAMVAATAAAVGRVHSVAVTGGEPLLHVEFLESFLPALREQGHRTFLETNGTRPEALERVRRWVDLASVDLKLPSTLVGLRSRHGTHQAPTVEQVLQAARGCSLLVKIPLAEGVAPEELEEAAAGVARVDPAIPVILQPVTAVPGGPAPPSLAHLMQAQQRLLRHLTDVRVLPQLHAAAGWD